MNSARNYSLMWMILLLVVATALLGFEYSSNVGRDRSGLESNRQLSGIYVPTCTFDETLQLISGNLTCVPVNCTAKYIGLRKVFNPIVSGVFCGISVERP
jgi:hypothetical protein